MKITNSPDISLIIPTHNRSDVLRKTLDALTKQTYPSHLFEVVVVADGCTDDTVKFLQQYTPPFALQVIVQESSGPAVARNCGAAKAKGDLLIFLDDDILASPGLVMGHVQAHKGKRNLVAVGYLPPILDNQTYLFGAELRKWWEAMFDRMRQPAHRFAYSDLLSGNFSLKADLFTQVGGFNTTLWCHEDYELGVRLLKANADLTFAAEAWGGHYEKTDLDRSLSRKFQEGRADVMLGYLHPELRSILPLANIDVFYSMRGYLLQKLVFSYLKIGDFLATILRRSINIAERLKLRDIWRRRLDGLLGYWYWRGVADELNTIQGVADFLQDTPSFSDVDAPEIEIDLRKGIQEAIHYVDSTRPAAVHIRYGQQPIGRIPLKPGTERLRGVHLRSILGNELSWLVIVALTLAVAKGEITDLKQVSSEFSIQLPEEVHVNQNA